MKVLLLLSLVGLSFAQTPAPTPWECITGEFAADGYTTGQNIELNYQGTQLQMDANGDTQIKVGFLVPKVYTTQYDGSAFSVTFNREHVQGAPGVNPTYSQITTNDGACFSNSPLTNITECSLGTNSAVWTNDGAVGQSSCVDYMYMTLSWTEAITGEAFGNVVYTDDGTSTRVYITATVETWRKFVQTTGANYLGQMTGSQQLNTLSSATSGQGSYWGDGGDLNVAFPALNIGDWRYTLYQIPFYLKFPKTVVVSNQFTIGSPIAVLNGVVSQDVIAVNMNPGSGLGAHGPMFAVLDVSVSTQVQYPYAIRGPSDQTAAMLAYIGGTNSGGGTHAASVSFVKWDDPSTCGGNAAGQICEQTFTLRVTPTTSQPCSVAGQYYLEFWATCINGGVHGTNSCGIGNNVQSSTMSTKRNSQAYFNLQFTVAHQDFCPEVIDTVHVAVDLQAYHDEGFTQPISNNYNGNPTAYTSNVDVVYTNDIIYYEATYRTGSQKAGAGNQVPGTNNAGAPGTDAIIDYVRAIKIFTDVYLGLSAPGTTTGTWNTAGWKSNLSWQLGGSRIPGPGEDFDDAALTVTGARVVQVPTAQPADSAHWRMIECEVAYIDPAVPIMTGVKPADCFTAITDIATDFMDFGQILSSTVGSSNSIDENEIAFRMRMDERVYPIGPNTDNSYVTVTVEAEVYYIGNLQPTRRLLQSGTAAAPANRAAQRQKHSKSMQHKVFYKPSSLNSCTLDTALTKTQLTIELDYQSNTSPDLNSVNAWALNLGAHMDKHILGSQYMSSTQNNVFTVSDVKKCTDTGCTTLLKATSAGRRLQSNKNIVFAVVDIESTAFNTAGELANLMQTEIATRGFVVQDAQILTMDAKDCNAVATTKNTKLASGASSLALLVSGMIAMFAAAL